MVLQSLLCRPFVHGEIFKNHCTICLFFGPKVICHHSFNRLETDDNNSAIDKIVLCVFDANDENIYRAVASQFFPRNINTAATSTTVIDYTVNNNRYNEW